MPEVPIPLGCRREFARAHLEPVGSSAGKGLNAAGLRARLQFKFLRTAPMTVVIAIREQGFERDAHRRRGPNQFQTQIAGIGALGHENALLQQRVGYAKAPRWYAFEDSE